MAIKLVYTVNHIAEGSMRCRILKLKPMFSKIAILFWSPKVNTKKGHCFKRIKHIRSSTRRSEEENIFYKVP